MKTLEYRVIIVANLLINVLKYRVNVNCKTEKESTEYGAG